MVRQASEKRYNVVSRESAGLDTRVENPRLDDGQARRASSGRNQLLTKWAYAKHLTPSVRTAGRRPSRRGFSTRGKRKHPTRKSAPGVMAFLVVSLARYVCRRF